MSTWYDFTYYLKSTENRKTWGRMCFHSPIPLICLLLKKEEFYFARNAIGFAIHPTEKEEHDANWLITNEKITEDMKSQYDGVFSLCIQDPCFFVIPNNPACCQDYEFVYIQRMVATICDKIEDLVVDS